MYDMLLLFITFSFGCVGMETVKESVSIRIGDQPLNETMTVSVAVTATFAWVVVYLTVPVCFSLTVRVTSYSLFVADLFVISAEIGVGDWYLGIVIPNAYTATTAALSFTPSEPNLVSGLSIDSPRIVGKLVKPVSALLTMHNNFLAESSPFTPGNLVPLFVLRIMLGARMAPPALSNSQAT